MLPKNNPYNTQNVSSTNSNQKNNNIFAGTFIKFLTTIFTTNLDKANDYTSPKPTY